MAGYKGYSPTEIRDNQGVVEAVVRAVPFWTEADTVRGPSALCRGESVDSRITDLLKTALIVPIVFQA
jgi:hypothetical protein